MTFWTTLRWTGALIFVLMLLVSWLGAERNGSGSSDQQVRPAPIIVR